MGLPDPTAAWEARRSDAMPSGIPSDRPALNENQDQGSGGPEWHVMVFGFPFTASLICFAARRSRLAPIADATPRPSTGSSSV